MANYQTHLESSRQLEQAFQNEVDNAQNAEVKNFYQKLASEQRTITNQLQNKVNTQESNGGTANADANANANANADVKANANMNAKAKNNKTDDTNA